MVVPRIRHEKAADDTSTAAFSEDAAPPKRKRSGIYRSPMQDRDHIGPAMPGIGCGKELHLGCGGTVADPDEVA